MISFRVYGGTSTMPDQTSSRFPLIDGFQFARTGQELRGKCPVAAFARLQDVLISNDGELDYEVLGTKDDMGRPALRVRVSGPLQLTCQRCLKALPYALRVDATLVLAGSEAEIEAQPVEPEGPDRILGGREMAVATLLEDEVLLSVPFAPRHEECAGAGGGKSATQGSPFADLRGMLNRGGRAGN
jgi:uncharacterized protein